ncbi:MAG: hypothetical protein B6D61_13930 [Bacteroidetes bacterium 4484_249]|nr:MAG: hypothetical protein B6D61_13930 [Bacteroidetes bacterium 4484_249]
MESRIPLHLNYESKFFNPLKTIGMKIKKSKKANLENKRGIYFQIGAIVSLALVLLAFEWTTVESEKFEFNLDRNVYIEDDIAEITIHKKKPEMPKPKIIRPITAVENEIEVEEEIEITSEVTKETFNEPEFFIEDEGDEQDEEPLFVAIPNIYPEFPGGLSAMQKFIIDNLEYPQAAREAGISGNVYIEFVVWKDGSIREVAVKRGIGGGCEEEAMRIVKLMPKWKPGLQRTKPVNVPMVLPVKFKLN